MSFQPCPGDAKLQFVQIDHPSDAKNANYRSKIRAHVARNQHRLARERDVNKQQDRVWVNVDVQKPVKRRPQRRKKQEGSGGTQAGVHTTEHSSQEKHTCIRPQPQNVGISSENVARGVFRANESSHRGVPPRDIASFSPTPIAMNLDRISRFTTPDERDMLSNDSNGEAPASDTVALPEMHLSDSTSRGSMTSPNQVAVAMNLDSVANFSPHDHSETSFEEIIHVTAPSTALLPNSRLGQSFSRGTMAFQTFALDDPHNVVGRTLNHLQLDVASVWAFYSYVARVQSHNYEQHFPQDGVSRETICTIFLHFVFSDPVVLNLAILLKTRILLQIRGSETHPKHLEHALRFRGYMIRRFNAELSDPVRRISDQMLVAVLMFAVHELHFVSAEAYHVHMNGLVQMINLRGGMAEIGRTDPYLERFLIWHDANASHEAGCEPFCRRVEEPSVLELPEADREMFRVEGWYEREGG